MKITKEAAVAVFTALGITTAEKWNATRLVAKLNKLNELVDDDTAIKDKKIMADVDGILAAIENGEAVEVGAEAAPAAAKGAKAAPAPAAAKPAKGAKGAKAEAPAKPAKGAKAAPAAAKPAKAEKPAAAPAAPKGPPGVRESPTRAFYAGQVVTSRGLAHGITEDMVAEVDELYGKENPVESLFRLRDAWHAIRAYATASKK